MSEHDPRSDLNRLLIQVGIAENGRTYVPSGKVPMDAEAILHRQRAAYPMPADPRVRDRKWRDLARRARDGDEVARAQLVLRNLGLVFEPLNSRWKTIRDERPATPKTLRNDLIQEASLALLDAAEGYDPDKVSAAFSTYATKAIWNALTDVERRRFNADASRYFAEVDSARTRHREGSVFDDVSDEGGAVRNVSDPGDDDDESLGLRGVKLSDSAGGVRKGKTLVGSLADVVYVMRSRGVRPKLTCEDCGETYRPRTQENASDWFRNHRGCAWKSDDVEYGHSWLTYERETVESAARKLRATERERDDDAYYRRLKDRGYALRKRFGAV
jgi:hypothetical protein